MVYTSSSPNEVQERIQQLRENIDNDTNSDEHIAQLERIDEYIHQAMLAGAKSYQKYYTWWSLELQHALLTKKYWMLKRIEAQHHISMCKTLQ